MSMTLEEAIKHAEAAAIENEKEAKRKREHGGWYYDSEARAWAICAEKNRQLAEWLRELQERRKADNEIPFGDSYSFTELDSIINAYEAHGGYHKEVVELLKELRERRKQPEIIHCGECIYYDPPHVEKENVRYEYSEMPKEAFDVLGTGLVSVEYGINVGGRCCVDYYCKNYSDDKRVYVPKDNYCGRAERRTDKC